MKTSTKGIIGMKKHLALCIAGALLFLSACDTLLTDAKDETAKILPDVYLAGGIIPQNDPYGPCIWKNGQRVYLERHPNIASAQYYVNAVFVDGDDVYAAGGEAVTASWAVCYWKNGKKHVVGPPANPYEGSIAYSIFVSNGNMYLAGTNAVNQVAIWFNGNRLIMPYLNNINGYTTSVIVDDGVIFVTGIENGVTPMLYRLTRTSSTATPIYDGSFYYVMPQYNSTIVVNGEAYVGGYTNNGNYPAYWYNGSVYLLDATYNGSVYGGSSRNGKICWSGQRYEPGTGGNYACYWNINDIEPHWLVPFDPGIYNSTTANAIHATDSGDIIWAGYLNQAPGSYGFVYNAAVYSLKNTGGIPHMFVKE